MPSGEKKASVSYQVSEQPSALVREEEFAQQLRLARYLAGASLGRLREMQRESERTPSLSKTKPRAKAQPGNKEGSRRNWHGKGGGLSRLAGKKDLHPVGAGAKSSDRVRVVNDRMT